MEQNLFDQLKELLSYSFILRSLAAGILIALCASLLGVILVLKRYSMIGDGLSHVGFGALAVAAAMNAAPLQVAIPVVVIAAFFLLRISESGKLKGDAAIALISSGSLAIGVMVVSVTSGMNTDLMNYLFGSILAISRSDLLLSAGLCLIVLILYLCFYNKLFAVTFDETFARATGIKAGFYNMLIAFLTAITVVLGMRMVGALLISSLIIFPSLTAMRLCKRFRTVVIASAVISVGCFLVGMFASYRYNTPAGATIVVCNLILFALFSIIGLFVRRS